ncbi:hypothetical protein MSPP1_002137 [Malassezia sp. CBS 17886]|nr:hypothetical protein MSPP1_002137 [Malassezia sp. CBS 17886]
MGIVTNEFGEQIDEGYLGNLTPQQEQTLKDFHRFYFEIVSRNHERSDELARQGGFKAAHSGSELKSNTSKDDQNSKSKEDAKRAQELKSVDEVVNKYGGKYIHETMWYTNNLDNPDMTALRFLRARKWDLDRSMGMCMAALQFRMDMNHMEILAKGEEGLGAEEGFLNQFRRGISYIEGNTDKGEFPIYFIHVARHYTSAQKIETLQRFVVLAMENARLLCTPPMEKAVIVFDMAGFGLKNMDWQCVLFIVKCLEAYYPESLQRIYVHGAPWIFKGIWAALQPLLDPVVQSKIKFSSKAHELEEYVPRSRFRKGMGGTLDWDWNYPEPVPGENDLMNDTGTREAIRGEYLALTNEMDEVTQQWATTQGPQPDLDYRRAVLANKIRLKVFQLSPYIRAVNVYQRTKVLRNDGLVTWTYPQLDGSVQSQQIGDRHNVPALLKWLRDHNEDTLENSVGGTHSPCMVVPTSYVVTDAQNAAKPAKKATKPKTAAAKPQLAKGAPDAAPRPARKPSKGDAVNAAGGAAGAGAVGAGAVVAGGAGAAGAAVARKRTKPAAERADRKPVKNMAEMPNAENMQRAPKKTPIERKPVPAVAPAEYVDQAQDEFADDAAKSPNGTPTLPEKAASAAPAAAALPMPAATQAAAQPVPVATQATTAPPVQTPEASGGVASMATGVAVGAAGAAGAALAGAASLFGFGGGKRADDTANAGMPRVDNAASQYASTPTAAPPLAAAPPLVAAPVPAPAPAWQANETPQTYTPPHAASGLVVPEDVAEEFVDEVDEGEDPDDVGEVEEERHVRNAGPLMTEHSEVADEYDLDDEERSVLSEDDDEDDDIAVTPETLITPSYAMGKVNPADCRQSDAELLDDLEVAHDAMELFLNGQMREAESLCAEGADHRLYRSVGMSLINTVKSIMTFEPEDMRVAMRCCKHSMAIADSLRKKQNRITKLLGQKNGSLASKTVIQQHAELVYAESLMARAVIGILYSGDTVGFIRQALNLRTAYTIMRDLLRMVERADSQIEEANINGRSSGKTVDQDLRSGVFLGNGLCSLILSLLPKRLLRVMEGFGLIGDRRYALELFARAGGWSKSKRLPAISAENEGVRRPLCDMAILVYHLVIASALPVTDVDLSFADKVLSWNLTRFPKGIFFLFFSARLYGAQALPEKAVEYYRSAIESQREYKQLHHLCFWGLSLTYLSTSDFDRSYECYDVLSRESNWSKAIYQYAKGAMLYESSAANRQQSNAIMRTVPKLVKKIAGRHIPFERFVKLKSIKFVEHPTQLGLPALEFSYLWHCLAQTPVFMLMGNQLTRIDEVIDHLETFENPAAFGTGESDFYSLYCLAFFLRGVALRFVAYPEQHTLVRQPPGERIDVAEVADDSIQSFQKVFEYGDRISDVDRYLVYYAHYELGRLYSAHGDEVRAHRELELVLSRKPLTAQESGPFKTGKADYLLSSLCQLRSYAALETMRIQRDRKSALNMTRSRTLRSRSLGQKDAAPMVNGAVGSSSDRSSSAATTLYRDSKSLAGEVGGRARHSRLVA